MSATGRILAIRAVREIEKYMLASMPTHRCARMGNVPVVIRARMLAIIANTICKPELALLDQDQRQ